MMRIQILGAGAWGTALALTLAGKGHTVTLVPRTRERAVALRKSRENIEYLPGYTLPEAIQVEDSLLAENGTESVYILACPSFGLRNWALRIRDEIAFLPENPPLLVSLAKGLESDTLLRPSEVIHEILPQFPVFALSGPNFAQEVARGLPTAAVLAGGVFSAELEKLQEVLSTTHFRVYISDDRVGVELGGCLKNVYAIGSGICQGLQLGENAKAALLTRSLNEMLQLIPCLKGRVETVYGLSGIGDLVATCYGELSRNRKFGEELARGVSVEESLNGQHSVVEGHFACANFHKLFRKHDINGPILEELYSVLYHNKAPRDALTSLMSRELKPEKQLPSTAGY